MSSELIVDMAGQEAKAQGNPVAEATLQGSVADQTDPIYGLLQCITGSRALKGIFALGASAGTVAACTPQQPAIVQTIPTPDYGTKSVPVSETATAPKSETVVYPVEARDPADPTKKVKFQFVETKSESGKEYQVMFGDGIRREYKTGLTQSADDKTFHLEYIAAKAGKEEADLSFIDFELRLSPISGETPEQTAERALRAQEKGEINKVTVRDPNSSITYEVKQDRSLLQLVLQMFPVKVALAAEIDPTSTPEPATATPTAAATATAAAKATDTPKPADTATPVPTAKATKTPLAKNTATAVPARQSRESVTPESPRFISWGVYANEDTVVATLPDGRIIVGAKKTASPCSNDDYYVFNFLTFYRYSPDKDSIWFNDPNGIARRIGVSLMGDSGKLAMVTLTDKGYPANSPSGKFTCPATEDKSRVQLVGTGKDALVAYAQKAGVVSVDAKKALQQLEGIAGKLPD